MPRAIAAHELPANAGRSPSRRFAFSALFRGICVKPAVASLLSVLGETSWGRKGTPKAPPGARGFRSKLSNSPTTTPVELQAGSLSDPGQKLELATGAATSPRLLDDAELGSPELGGAAAPSSPGASRRAQRTEVRHADAGSQQ